MEQKKSRIFLLTLTAAALLLFIMLGLSKGWDWISSPFVLLLFIFSIYLIKSKLENKRIGKGIRWSITGVIFTILFLGIIIFIVPNLGEFDFILPLISIGLYYGGLILNFFGLITIFSGIIHNNSPNSRG